MSMSAALKLERNLVSEEAFLAQPESLDRAELIDGEVIVPPAPSPLHQYVTVELLAYMHAWARANPPATLGLAPLDVRLAPGRIVQPDLFLVLAGFSPRAIAPLRVVPDLVVEVISHDRSYDRITKRALYHAAGVPEYWIVDPFAAEIEHIRGLETVDVVREGAISSAVAEGLVVPLAAIFPP